MQPTIKTNDYELYLGDCLPILREMESQSVNCIITDPPYGMNLDTDYSGIDGGRGKTYERVAGDDVPFDPRFLLSIAPICIIWGAQYFATKLPENGAWFVFNKRGYGAPSAICFGDCEIAWTNIDKQSVRMYAEQWHGMPRVIEGTFHPTQKSIGLMKWCIQQSGVPEGATILDPFMGSGTTGVAAIELGRKFIGIELNPDYFEIARKRISAAREQEVLSL